MRAPLVLSLAFLLATPAVASAGKKKRAAAAAKASAAKKPATVSRSKQKAVTALLGPWKWGMTPDQVLAALEKQLEDRAAPQLAKMEDVYAQIQVRKKIKDEVAQVRDSLIKFEGQRTGWDVSIIEGEFLHRHDESMMLYRENDPATGRDQERFFFFYGGKLWKQFIAFNMEAYKGKTFDDFRVAMEARYGKGTPITKTERDGKKKVIAVAWRSGDTVLRAIDLLQFYANFCLAFSDAGVEAKMEAERLARAPKAPRVPHGTVSDGQGPPPVNDPNADIVNRITAEPATTPKKQ